MQIVNEYISYLKDKRNLSENTVNSYFIDIKKYIEYIKNKEIKLNDIVENDIISYIIYLEKQNVSVATISRMISSIKSFHDYLISNRICEKNPAKNIKKPKIDKENIEILTKEEIEALLKFPELSTPKLIRDKAIFEILYGTGMKVSELIELNVSDIEIEMEYISCTSGKNQRIIPLSDTTLKYLEKYVLESRNILANTEEEALFVNSLGSRFTRQGLWKVIKKYAKSANINKNINPTMLRNSFAIHLLNEGANIAVVNKILGNSNLSSLQSYVKYINNNVRKELKEKHPRK